MYLRNLQYKKQHYSLNPLYVKIVRYFVFSIILFLAILLSSLTDTESSPLVLLDSLNSPGIIYFEFGKYDLKEESFSLLERLAAELNGNHSINIEITGYTDNIGSEEFNNNLSIQRAESVRLFLIQKGVKDEQIIVRGEGFKNPVTGNNNEYQRSLNRRVEFKMNISGISEELPKKETDESFANTGSWKTSGNEISGQLSVRDTNGIPVTDIDENDISAVLKWQSNGSEDSAGGTVKLFPIDDKKKIAFTLTMDYSPSMYDDQFNQNAKKTEKILQMEKAVLTFIDEIDRKNFVKIIKFGREIDVLVRFTKSRELMRNAVNNRCYPREGTALYKSVYTSLIDTAYNSNPTIIKAVIAFTDGEENSSGLINKDSIYRQCDDKGTRVFTVGLIDEFSHSVPVGMKSIAEADLVEIAKRTGGFYYWAKDPAVLPLIYKQIYEQIMKSYNISVLWEGDNLPLKGTPVTAVVRVNVKGMIRTLYKNYIME